MIISYTWRNVGLHKENKADEYEIKEYKLVFNSGTQMFDFYEMKFFNTVIRIIKSESIKEKFDTHRNQSEVDRFEKFCDEIAYNIKEIDGWLVDKDDGGYSYIVKSLLFEATHMPIDEEIIRRRKWNL